MNSSKKREILTMYIGNILNINKNVTSTADKQPPKNSKNQRKSIIIEKMFSVINENPTVYKLVNEIVDEYSKQISMGNNSEDIQLSYIVQLLALCNSSINKGLFNTY